VIQKSKVGKKAAPVASTAVSSSACRYIHYAHKQHKTLGECLSRTDDNNKSTVLETTEAAFLEATQDAGGNTTTTSREEALGGMEMLYYFSIPLTSTAIAGIGPNSTQDEAEQEQQQQQPVGQILSKALQIQSCTHASLVYVAYENELIFDRYQGGTLVPELGIIFGDSKRTSVAATPTTPRSAGESTLYHETSEDHTLVGAESMPGAVLEYILMFLPDPAISSMARVCKAWNNEIGRDSSHLWCEMLDRRGWPRPAPVVPNDTHSDPIPPNDNDAKHCFQMHYRIVRDVTAIKDALSALLNPR
jgi:hypothetical protein